MKLESSLSEKLSNLELCFFIENQRELVQYLVEKRKAIDFSKPEFTIDRQDSEDIRQKILSISYTEWKNRVFSKSNLHYIMQNAKADKPFTLNAHAEEGSSKFQ